MTVSHKLPPMKVKIFGYLAVFVAFTLFVLWFFETVLLEQIYTAVQYSQLNTTVRAVADKAAGDDLQTLTDSYAGRYQICSRVFAITDLGEGRLSASEKASSHIRDFCLIHYMNNDDINRLYSAANDAQGGEYIERTSFDGFHKTESTSADSGVPDLLIGACVRTEGEVKYLVIVSSPISPVQMISPTLTLILFVSSIILVFGAAAGAYVIANRLSSPIIFMNNAASQLARGNYDVRFSGHDADGDLSRYRETEQLGRTLDYAAHELGQLDRLQKELIANIGHDLRTPLTMIRGYGEVMRDIPGEMSQENIQVIIDETDRLSSLVSDVLDISKLGADGIPVNRGVFDVTAMLDGTLTRYNKLTEKDGFTITVASDAHVYVNADRTRILQVVYNLMNNAVNYSGDDKTVEVRQIITDGSVRIEIADHGEGIAPDALPYIWDRYYRVDRVHKRAAVGSGLGLSIVRGILEAHGAKYGVDSKPGQGSTFWFELPTVPPPTDAIPAPTDVM